MDQKEEGNFWDYLLVILKNTKEKSVFIEIHPAQNNNNIREILQKLFWLDDKIKELNLNKFPFQKFWISSAKVAIPQNTKARRQLAMFGISSL